MCNVPHCRARLSRDDFNQVFHFALFVVRSATIYYSMQLDPSIRNKIGTKFDDDDYGQTRATDQYCDREVGETQI